MIKNSYLKIKGGQAPFASLISKGAWPLLGFLLFFSTHSLEAATGTKAMVATADPRATQAALEVLKGGGNAVDAAIAAQWVLNVVEPQSSGIGGGGFFLFYEASSKHVFTYDGRETAPAKAFAEMFLDPQGTPYLFDPDRITGGLPVGVPGVLKLLSQVHEKHASGKFSFAELFDPAIRYAENGFEISQRMAYFLDREKERLRLFGETKKIFFDEDGLPYGEGYILKQPDLAETFRLIQKEGIGPFYEGEIALSMVKAVQEVPFHPGFMELEDLQGYKVAERPAVSQNYRGYEVFSMGPPSSGGTTLTEALNILEIFPLAAYGRSVEGFYFFSQAQKIAFEDRNRYSGDSDFVNVPVEKLISKDFAHERAKNISGIEPVLSETKESESSEPTSNTSHISIVDEAGNMVSFTTTIEAVFGCAMVVPGRGFFLNNELTDFEAIPHDLEGNLHPNSLQPGKRPRSSMTPTFVFRDGRPFLIAGSPGGPRIIGAVLNVMVNLIDFGMKLDEAMAAPRMIHRGNSAELEEELFQNQEIKTGLENKGMAVSQTSAIGNVQAIYFDSDQKWIVGQSDSRGEGRAEGY